MTTQSSEVCMSLPERAMDKNKGGLLRCPSCGTHYFEGGEVGEEFDREHKAELGQDRRTRKYDRDFDHYYAQGEADEADRFSDGGYVDGAGKVDGIHTHPSECSHLSSGGPCRHQPGHRKPSDDDHSDGDHVRNFADGGFAGYLVKRSAYRRAAKAHTKGG